MSWMERKSSYMRMAPLTVTIMELSRNISHAMTMTHIITSASWTPDRNSASCETTLGLWVTSFCRSSPTTGPASLAVDVVIEMRSSSVNVEGNMSVDVSLGLIASIGFSAIFTILSPSRRRRCELAVRTLDDGENGNDRQVIGLLVPPGRRYRKQQEAQ
ncbi:hypothetical protein LX32DRAFT_3083 [Colletotrichum zoysiae]|uniref:Uncharacterized protein n=1 Tax=Colletotrichum zoysiae TaxID=1216348 RepID=A0AAD9M5P7_9PEZI|nr:hypothetical protein LX32DRAFT_3083 [Colletotrichum zoysiae]